MVAMNEKIPDEGSQSFGGDHYYLLQDTLYRAVALTNSSGAVVEAYDTDAYGQTIIFTAPGTDGVWFTDDDVQSNYGANETIFCGYRFDPETQLYYVRNRSYNPVLGRWLQRDPVGYSGGINLYGYVGSSPVGNVDAWGRKWVRLKGVEYCEAYYAGSWSPIPVHAFIFVSGHEYGFFPKLPPSGLPNEIRDLIYEEGIIHTDDGYSSLHEGDKGVRTGALYR